MVLHANLSFVNALWMNRIMAMATLAIPLTIFGFTIHFLSLRKQRVWIPIGFLIYAIILIINLGGYLVTDVQIDQGLVINTYGWGQYPVAVYWVMYLYGSGYFLLRERLRTNDPNYKNRLDYLLLVVILLSGGNILNATSLKAYPIDLLFAALAALLISISISRYQVLELQRSIRRGAVLVAIILTYVIVVTGALYVFGRIESNYRILLSLAAALLTAALVFGYRPLRDGLSSFIERVFLPQSYDIQELIYSISEIGNRLQLPNELAEAVLIRLDQDLQPRNASLLLIDDQKERFETIAILKLPAEAKSVNFRADSPLTRELSLSSEAMHVNRLRELPIMGALWIEEWRGLDRLGSTILIPIHADKNELLGFMTLGAREQGEPYTRQELRQIFPTLANQISIALANSRMFAQEQSRADALAQANEELRRLDMMKDELIQTVSHELRTPLSIVHGYAELLTKEEKESITGYKLSPEAIAETILQQSQRLVLLVNDILLLTQIGTEQTPFEPVAMDSLVRTCCQEMALTTEHPIIMESVQTPEYIPMVMGVSHRLRQVVDNLLTNAIKFSLVGGSVYVSVYEDEGSIITTVRDEGLGISSEDQEYIWDRFYQGGTPLTSKRRGAGLGLAIAKKIVDWHGGWINLESEEGQGAIFRFGLPIAEDDLSEIVEIATVDDALS